MITRDEMIAALINKYRIRINDQIASYEKKVKTQVGSALEDEYNIVILGKMPKAEKKAWKKEQ